MSDKGEYGCDVGFEAGYQCGKDEAKQRIAELEQQRDELLAAIERYLGDESETTAGLARAVAKVKQ